MPRVVVASNRVPTPAAANASRGAGGLVAALLPAMEAAGTGLWFGWSGDVLESGSHRLRDSGEDARHAWSDAGVDYLTVDLTAEEVHGYYEEFCNRVLWPWFHGLPKRASEPAAAHFNDYRLVNRRFAEVLFRRLRSDDLVWIHDYHMIPLGTELRSLGWRGRLGYFHHVPVPAPDDCREIPHAATLALDLEAYDLIGVQTERDADRLREILGPRVAQRIAAYPISIDPVGFRALLDAPEAGLSPDRTPALPDDGRMLFFGVDRLDYSKAIPARLEAFGRALDRHPELRARARLVQWCAPSRTGIPEYQDERAAVEMIAAAIVKRHGPDVLHVDFEGGPPQAVAAALARADVCIVNSVADGMNLVAKEYAAVHDADHPGVLILSDTCGAAEELTDALVIPANDGDALTDAIEAVFAMPVEERARRAGRLRVIVDTRSTTDWYDAFVTDLSVPTPISVGLSGTRRVGFSRLLRDRVEQRLREFDAAGTVQRIWTRDHTLWKPEPDEIANRLGWLELDREMSAHVEELHDFAREVLAEGYTTAVLLGMGGSSLAPRVFASTFAGRVRGLNLVVLDSTVAAEIESVQRRIEGERVLFIVSSKSGTTMETQALLDYFWERRPDGRDWVAITDPGTVLEQSARDRGFRRVFLNPSDIGGRYSALSFFGLVPAALLGIDLRRLLDSAARMREACAADVAASANPGARLGATLAEAAILGRPYLWLESGTGGFAGWLEQLIAESTGKDGAGILPIVGAPAIPAADRVISARDIQALARTEHDVRPLSEDPYALGGEYLRWEFAVAVAGSVLGINPFDQPDVESTKLATARILRDGVNGMEPAPLGEVLDRMDTDQYLAVHAYLPQSPEIESRLSDVRSRLHDQLGVPVTLEYGPSLLHSTGQYHKGGGQHGAFIQVVAPDGPSLEIPGRTYCFDELTEAQASGDMAALAERGRLVARASLDSLEAL